MELYARISQKIYPYLLTEPNMEGIPKTSNNQEQDRLLLEPYAHLTQGTLMDLINAPGEVLASS